MRSRLYATEENPSLRKNTLLLSGNQRRRTPCVPRQARTIQQVRTRSVRARRHARPPALPDQRVQAPRDPRDTSRSVPTDPRRHPRQEPIHLRSTKLLIIEVR